MKPPVGGVRGGGIAAGLKIIGEELDAPIPPVNRGKRGAGLGELLSFFSKGLEDEGCIVKRGNGRK